MCGIFGVVNYNISEQTALRCLQTIAHRGPDGWGVYQREKITLGLWLLSIIELSENEKQPMEYCDGRYVISFNGEIYNFLELRLELSKAGYSFKSESDTEVILAAYMHWKENCLYRFNGMWAFMIWDSVENTLFLSRDRFGIKPLYYTMLNKRGAFGIASEMKALIPLLSSVNINDTLINRKGIFGYEATSECIIKEIQRFPAGSYGYIRNGELKIERWWNTLDHLPEIPNNYDEQTAMFRELFLDACKIRMRSDVTIGTALSGGLDSSATICTMAHIANNQHAERINSDWQHAFVAAFPGTVLDESAYAKKVTDFLGISHTFINIDPYQFADRLDRKSVV